MKPVIFFDWDGTLADSIQLCIEEQRETLRQMNLPDQPDEVLALCNGPTFVEAAPLIGIPPDRVEEYCRVRSACETTLVEKSRLFPGVPEMLNELRNHADLCIVSNGMEPYIKFCLKLFGMEDVFCRVMWYHPERTKAQNLALLMEELQPERAVMVGDRIGDIHAGHANGIPAIAAAFGYGNDQEWAEADFRADNVAELHAQLLQWVKA